MATDSFPTTFSDENDLLKNLDGWAKAILKPIASLRLTVVLFFLAILLIFLSTLAQAQAGMNMVKVIEDYFRSYIVMVNLGVLFVPSWFPELHEKVTAMNIAFPLPGGFTIGVAMAFNLLAAHLVRFKIQAKGPLLALGVVTLAVGTFITYWVIVSGHNADGLQGRPPFAWSTLWIGIRGALFASAFASGVALVMGGNNSIGKRILLFAMAVTFGGLGFWASSVMLDESSLRILWQLIQGGLAGLILLIGCALVFKRRAGIVLLHAGIGLMMFSEFFVSQYAVEGRMTIGEGETVNFLRDIREVELAIIDESKAETEDVIVVPGSRLLPKKTLFGGSTNEKVLISDASLPFDIHVEDYMQNSDLVDVVPGAENYANKGAGKKVWAKEVRAGSGAGGGEVDFASAYVEFRRKGSNESLGKYLLSQIVSSQGFSEDVEIDGKIYACSLRFKRDYKPYSVSLKDVRKDDYVGTNTPMNYSSDIVLTKADTKVGDFHIWMNNPLRYSGETFYQSGYDPGRGEGESTTLQVVANTGWMMPYIGCMLVAVGMAAHFCGGLWRFLEKKLSEELTGLEKGPKSWVEIAIPFVVVLVFGAYAASKFRPPKDTKANMKIHEFGKLPVVFQGRVKPLDTLARNTMRVVSGRETFVAGRPDPSVKRPKKLPAIQWMLDVISGSPEAKTHRVYRIDNMDVLGRLGLQPRKRFRYAEEEFTDKLDSVNDEIEQVAKIDSVDLNLYQRKLLEFGQRVRAVRKLEAAFLPPSLPAMPTEDEFKSNREEAISRMQTIGAFLKSADRMQAALMRMEPPLAIPVNKESDKATETEWQPFANAWGTAYLARFSEKAEVSDSTLLWSRMLSAYGATNVNDFNEAVFEYQQALASETPSTTNAKGNPEAVDLAKLRYEHFFNSSQPFMSSLVLYVVAFVLVCGGWLAAGVGKFTVFNRSAYWLILFTFVLHSFALCSRVYISGRPPITNLYSSAVFIGWACVLLGLLLEFFYKRGIGNALGTIAGFSTLLIAYALAADGDTFTVLQAVLDTQFWLATHVVCITLGYSTTFVAGLLGILYILSMASRRPELGKALTSMTYGTLCFAIFFSFVGTVLGGLWADDSWGRFWGWDPKENGALMIVLWNALVLHARWGGMIRQRGIAMLAILGNVVTAWSWFGVNELNVGLHSYGFTEGVLMYLGLFVLSQVLIIGIGIATMRDGKQALAS